MNELATDRTDTTCVETILRDDLARGNRALGGVAPVISHMLESSGHALVSDAIVARLRGMLAHIARQLLGAAGPGQRANGAGNAAIDAVADSLAGDSAVLNHLYAAAMEGYLTERLEQRSSVDPVLSPLLQELIASDQAAVAELAMNSLAAQSRFTQSQRRMEVPLGELPAELFLSVLKCFEKMPLNIDPAVVSQSTKALKEAYDEGASRIGLFTRLVSSMRGGAVAALELDHAGMALFTTGIAVLTRQPRNLAILACHERQAARLALSLRSGGLNEDAIERQFLLIQPSEMLPGGIGEMSPKRALELLAAGQSAS